MGLPEVAKYRGEHLYPAYGRSGVGGYDYENLKKYEILSKGACVTSMTTGLSLLSA